MKNETGAASPKYGPQSHHADEFNTPKSPGKELQMLALFAAEHSLNRFQAEKHGDHCLPTTVSDLQKRFRIQFNRQQETVPTRFGRPTRATRYWLEGEALEKARRIIRASRINQRQADAQNQEQ